MEKAKMIAARIVGAIGWLILGVVLMVLEIGPWWFGWVAFAISLGVIACAVDQALTPKERWAV